MLLFLLSQAVRKLTVTYFRLIKCRIQIFLANAVADFNQSCTCAGADVEQVVVAIH